MSTSSVCYSFTVYYLLFLKRTVIGSYYHSRNIIMSGDQQTPKRLSTNTEIHPPDYPIRHWVSQSLSNESHTLCNYKLAETTHLWKESHLMLSISTTPEVISNAANSNGSIPSSSCFLNWIPEFCSRSMLSCAYISSLIKTIGLYML